MEKYYSKEDLLEDIVGLGVKEGDILNVKVSMKSIGKIQGGAETLIEALLDAVGKSGTIFCDAFVQSFPAYKVRLNPKSYITTQETPSYAGAFVNAMIKYPSSKRSSHPIHKFVAIGAHADWVEEHTTHSGNYRVLFRLIENNAKNLKIGLPEKVPGVGTTHCTIESLGWKEKMKPLAVSYYDENGKIRIYEHNWPTGCMKAFNKFIPLYEKEDNWGSKGKVGDSYALLTNMRVSYDLEMKICKNNPDFLRCDNPMCMKCRLGWAHSHDNYITVMKDIFKIGDLRIFKQWCEHVFLYKYEPR